MNNLIELDSALVELEVARDKALTISCDLKEDYFSMREPKDWFLQANYDVSALKIQVVLDYLYQIKDITDTLRTLVENEFQKAKGEGA